MECFLDRPQAFLRSLSRVEILHLVQASSAVRSAPGAGEPLAEPLGDRA